MDVFAYDAETFELAPSAEFKFTSLLAITNPKLILHKTTSPHGIYLAELRVYTLSLSVNYGVSLRRYNLISDLPSQLVEYVRIADSNLIINSHNNTVTSLAVTGSIEFPLQMWDKNYKISSNTSQCDECTSLGCQYCQIVTSAYADLCRICDSSYFSCNASTICPVDYYMNNGVWLRCPIGCNECTSENTCTACDSGLTLTTLANSSVTWKCPSGQYGVENTLTDTLNCNACDPSCTTCDVSSTNWTSCSSPNYLLNNACGASCGSGKYQDSSDYTWQNCSSDWDIWTDNTTCTSWNSPMFLSEAAWVASCPTNSLVNGAACDKCNTGCSTCDTVVTNCTACDSGYYLNGTTCVTSWGDGYYGDSNTRTWHQWDTPTCNKCTSFTVCTECNSTKTLLTDGTWGNSWDQDEYLDQYSASIKFCRNWPSTCATCTNMTKWNTWKSGFYKWTESANVIKCVGTWPDGTYPDVDGSSNLIWTSCMTDWARCTNGTTWKQCDVGKVSQTNGASVDTCKTSCDTKYYDLGGVCTACDSDWDSCTGNNQCTTWSSGYSRNGTICIADASCTGNYYVNSGVWTQWPSECTACTSASACSSCANGYSLTGTTCNPNCGNRLRDEFETCDDGNSVGGDGCSATWQTETDYVWYTQTSPLADIWYCNPYLKSARWLSNWREIELVFGTQIMVDTVSLGDSPSDNPLTFCTQIIDSTLHTSLGSDTICTLTEESSSRYVLRISLSSDSTFGQSQPSVIKLNHLKTNNSCSIAIPTDYTLLGLPYDVPVLELRQTTFEVSKCTTEFLVDMFDSKGMTSRNAQSIAWNILSVNALTSSATKIALDSHINTNFANLRYVKFDQSAINNVTGTPVELKVNATNFLGKSSSETIEIKFLSYKKIVLEGIHSTYSLQTELDNKFFISAKIPVCSGDDMTALISQERSIILSCELYNSDGVTSVANLTNWTIPANTMSSGTSYKIKFTATNPSDSNMTTYDWSDIHVNNSDFTVFINGGNREISLDINNTFEANVEPKTSNLVYYWMCHDVSSGSFCVNPQNVYLTFPNSPSIELASNSLYPDKDYIFTLSVEDSVTKLDSSYSVRIHAKAGLLLDVKIESRHNKHGYIDYSMPSMFVCNTTLNGSDISIMNATYSWAVTSNGLSISLTNSTQSLNGLLLPANTLQPQTVYSIQVNVSYQTYTGSANIEYNTIINTDYDFQIEPSSGVALSTQFIMAVSIQSHEFESSQFAFGYISDNKRQLLTRGSPVALNTVILPQGDSSNSDRLTVFWEIINAQGKTFYLEKVITVTASTVSENDFISHLNETAAGSMNDAMKIKILYEHFKASMSDNTADQIVAINSILDGLQRDGKPFCYSKNSNFLI